MNEKYKETLLVIITYVAAVRTTNANAISQVDILQATLATSSTAPITAEILPTMPATNAMAPTTTMVNNNITTTDINVAENNPTVNTTIEAALNTTLGTMEATTEIITTISDNTTIIKTNANNLTTESNTMNTDEDNNVIISISINLKNISDINIYNISAANIYQISIANNSENTIFLNFTTADNKTINTKINVELVTDEVNTPAINDQAPVATNSEAQVTGQVRKKRQLAPPIEPLVKPVETAVNKTAIAEEETSLKNDNDTSTNNTVADETIKTENNTETANETTLNNTDSPSQTEPVINVTPSPAPTQEVNVRRKRLADDKKLDFKARLLKTQNQNNQEAYTLDTSGTYSLYRSENRKTQIKAFLSSEFWYDGQKFGVNRPAAGVHLIVYY